MPTFKQRLISLLRFSERYTRLDMLYVTQGGFWTSFGHITSALLSLILVIAFANLLPKETYGLYRYVLSLSGALSIFTLTGMNGAVARAVARGDEGAFQASVAYQIKWNILMCAAFFALAGYYIFRGNETLAVSLVILGVFVPPTLALNTYNAYLEGKREFRRNNLYSVLSSLVYVAGMLVVLYMSGEVVWLVFAYAATVFVSTALFYAHTLKTFRPPSVPIHTEVFAYGRQLTFISFIAPFASQIDKIILAHFWGPASLAVYAIASTMVDKLATLVKGWVDLGLPKLSLKTEEEIAETFYLRLFQGALLGAAAAAAYAVMAPYLFTFLLPQYLDALDYSRLLALSLIFNIPGKYVGVVLESLKLTRVMFTRSIIERLAQIALYLTLGIWGGIAGLVLAYVINSALALLVQITGWHWRRF